MLRGPNIFELQSKLSEIYKAGNARMKVQHLLSFLVARATTILATLENLEKGNIASLEIARIQFDAKLLLALCTCESSFSECEP